MTSLSDSQNIDTDPPNDGRPTLPPGSPLQLCPSCEALLDISEREPLERISCPQCGSEMMVHGQIGHYQIVEVAGRGGMGVVYKAYDSSLDRYVALKLLRKDHSADTKLIQQLETEAAITATVTDPHVVRVFGTGVDRQRFYIIMELVNKGSLDDLIHLQGRVAEAQVLNVGIQAAKGLAAAQKQGLIHRDVKPGNILFADTNSAKIVDFGLAIFMEQEESVRGEVWGTPYYVAPEKLDQQPEDFRSDMYSLGASLFHALAGRPPFEAESASMVALKHLKSQPVSLQAFAPWVSNATAHIINRTLSKDPAQRFQSYEELIDSLEYAREQLHHKGAVAAERARITMEDEKTERRWAWVLAAMAGVLVVGGVGFLVSHVMSSRKAAAVAKTQQAAARPGARYEPIQKAIDAFIAKDPETVELFTKAASNSSFSPADRTWARLFQGATLLVAGKPDEAKNAFHAAAALAPSVKDPAMAEYFENLANRLQKPQVIPPEDAARLDGSTHEAASLLLYALWNWELWKTDEALEIFRQFRAAEPRGTAEWIGQFKPIAVDYIDRDAAFRIAADQLESATTPEERYEAAKSLRNLDRAYKNRAEALLKPYTTELNKYKADLAKPPTLGIFRLVNQHSGKVLEVRNHAFAAGNGVAMADPSGKASQFWQIVPSTKDVVRLKAVHSRRVLDLTRDPAANAMSLAQHNEDKAFLTQKWRILPEDEGWFRLQNEGNGLFLAPADSTRDNGIDATVRSEQDSPELRWRFERVATPLGVYAGYDIGACKSTYEHDKDAKVYTVKNGSHGIAGKSDNFSYAFRELGSTNFEYVVRLKQMTVITNAKAGVMIRLNYEADSPHVSLFVLADGSLLHQYRPAKGEDSSAIKVAGEKPPVWLKLHRRGENVTSFSSTDGENWQEISKTKIPGMKSTVMVGMAVSSHNPDREITAKFESVLTTSVTSSSSSASAAAPR